MSEQCSYNYYCTGTPTTATVLEIQQNTTLWQSNSSMLLRKLLCILQLPTSWNSHSHNHNHNHNDSHSHHKILETESWKSLSCRQKLTWTYDIVHNNNMYPSQHIKHASTLTTCMSYLTSMWLTVTHLHNHQIYLYNNHHQHCNATSTDETKL